MQILDGKALSIKLLDKIKQEVEIFEKKPHLAVILVGEDPASQIYVNIKKKACEKIGFQSSEILLPSNVSEQELIQKIEELNSNTDINAILVQMPLPKHINANNCINKISAIKDVDGFTPTNLGAILQGETPYAYPCTPKGIITLMEEYGIQIQGKHAVIVGRSNIVGKPLSVMLLNKNSTVTICHSYTENLIEITKTADILISAVGKRIITKNMVKDNAVVIDVGISKNADGKISGDVDFENVKEVASFITPVPGGIGPMTIATLMENTISLFKKQR